MKRRGSNIVEFALLVPIIVLLIAGTVDLAVYVMLSDALVSAVGEGARSGAQVEAGSDPKETALLVAKAAWMNAELPGEVSFELSIDGSAPDQLLVLAGSVPYEPFFGFVGLPKSVDYKATVRLVNASK